MKRQGSFQTKSKKSKSSNQLRLQSRPTYKCLNNSNYNMFMDMVNLKIIFSTWKSFAQNLKTMIDIKNRNGIFNYQRQITDSLTFIQEQEEIQE